LLLEKGSREGSSRPASVLSTADHALSVSVSPIVGFGRALFPPSYNHRGAAPSGISPLTSAPVTAGASFCSRLSRGRRGPTETRPAKPGMRAGFLPPFGGWLVLPERCLR